MAASNLLNFKRGTQAQLDRLKRDHLGKDGCFYLVVDETNNISGSSRLYVGRSNGDIVPVNQGIITVSKIGDFPSSLTSGQLQAGDFVYASDDNVLAVYSNGKWIQLNTDQYIAALSDSITVSNNVATITTTGTYNTQGTPAISTNFKVTGSKNIDVKLGANNTTLDIEGDVYGLSSSGSSNTATIKLASEHIADAGTIVLANATDGNMTITESNGTISLKAADKSVKSLSSATGTYSNGTKTNDNGFTIAATTGQDNNGVTYRTSIDPIVTYGKDGDQTAHFVGGTAALNVYSKADIDAKLNQADAMTYKGTVGTGGSAATSYTLITSPAIGDTFKAVGGDSKDGAFTIPANRMANNTETKVFPGDLLVVSGAANTEVDGVVTGTVKFDVIPSGDDFDTTYSISDVSHGIKVVESRNNTSIGSITINPGTLLTAADTAGTGTGTNKVVTLNHGAISLSKNSGSSSVAEVNNDLGAKIELEVVTGVTGDGYGHVNNYETKKLVINSTSDKITSFSQTGSDANNVATVQTSIQVTDPSNHSATKSVAFDVTSDNLTVDTSTTTKTLNGVSTSVPVVSMNFYWGSFEDDIPNA